MQSFLKNKMKEVLGMDTDKGPVSSKKPTGDFSGGNDPLAHMRIGDKWSYTTLEYPEDLQQRSDLGHYMLFYINVPVNSNYKAGVHGTGDYQIGKQVGSPQKKKANPRDSLFGMPSGVSEPKTSPEKLLLGNNQQRAANSKSQIGGGAGERNKVVQRTHHQGTVAGKLNVQRLTRTNSAIALYMPPQIVANYMSAYKEQEMGALVGMGSDALGGITTDALAAGTATDGVAAFKSTMAIAAEQVKKAAKQSLSAAGADIIGAAEKAGNIAQNNFLEVMYSGPTFRKFSYTWKFTPKSPDEAIEIDKIIRTFKFHMLPEMSPDKLGRYYILPAEFDIFYMFRGDENTFINKISSCVCTGVDVNYTPQQYQSLRPINGRNGVPMSEIDFKLDFMETKLITKEDILQGY